jgi:hypothetical protein
MDRRQGMRVRLSLGLGLMLGFTAACWSEEAARLSVAEVEAGIAAWLGREVVVEARYRACWAGRYVEIVGSSLRFYLEPGSALGKALNADRDGAGSVLQKGVSNILLQGRVRVASKELGRLEAGQPIVLVARLTKLPDDIPRFVAEAALARAQRDSAGALRAVAERARAFAERYESKALAAWSYGPDRESLELIAESLEPADLEGRLSLAERYVLWLADTRAAVAVLDGLALGGVSGGGRVERRLAELGARFHGGHWLSLEDYRRVHGYVRRASGGETVWVKRERAELLDASAEHIAAGARAVARFARGDPLRLREGMSREQVVSARLSGRRLGFADRVDRILVRTGERARSYVQWVYEGGVRLYFVDGHLMKIVPATRPFPAR